jgi:hypothetical protein
MVFLSFSDMVLLSTMSLLDVIEDVSENMAFSSTEGSEAKAEATMRTQGKMAVKANFII